MNCNTNSTLFENIIKGKSKLIFIITDTKGNKFGGYVNATIHGSATWINDPQAFVFSLNSKGRLSGMRKFNVKRSQCAFNLGPNSSPYYLLLFGGNGLNGQDITLRKRNSPQGHHRSYCSQDGCYEYGGISNALAGERDFDMSRLVVIQMS